MPPLLFELCNWTQIEMTGRDRQSFLHGFCTNDIKRLTPGQGCEAFLSNIKGRIIGHIWAFVDENRLCLESEPGQAAAIISHLDKYLIAEDVQLVDRSGDRSLLLLAGEGASEALIHSGLCPSPPNQTGDHAALVVEGSDDRGSIRRSDLAALPNWTISVAASAVDGVKSRLTSAGAQFSDAATFESLRIVHGYPLFGVDLTDDNLVHESARVAQTVSFNKGCYLGQEPIARLDSLGHVNRHLCRLRIATDANVTRGASLYQEGEEVGHVTSAARDPSGAGVVAIAMVKRSAATPQAVLKVVVGTEVSGDATVLPLM
jgi:folate-binding protein YgfZ